MKRSVMFVVLLSFLLATGVTPTAWAVGKQEARDTLRAFLLPFLAGDYDAAAEHALGNPERWASAFATQLPGDQPVKKFEIVELRGKATNRNGAIWIERGEIGQVFYADLDESGKVARFYSILEISAPFLDRVNAAAEATENEILGWGAEGQDKNAFINTLRQQMAAVSAYRTALDRHIGVMVHMKNRAPSGDR